MYKSGIEINSLYIPSEWNKTSFADFVMFGPEDVAEFWPRAFRIIRGLGLDGFEMTAGIGSVKSALLWKQNARGFKEELDQAGMEVCTIFYSGLVSPRPFHADYSSMWKVPERKCDILDEISEISDFAKTIDCKYLVLGVPMRNEFSDNRIIVDEAFWDDLSDLINSIAETAEKNNVSCLLHTESNSVLWKKKDIQELFKRVHPQIGFCPDTAHMISAGEEPVSVIEPYFKRMAAFHWKDCIGRIPDDLDGTHGIFISHIPFIKAVGEGIMDQNAWTDFLRKKNFEGWAIFEIPGDVGMEGIQKTVSYGKQLLRSI